MHADNSLFDFFSGTAFHLIPELYGGLDGVLFDDGRKYMPLDVNVNFILYFRRPYSEHTLLAWYCQHFLTCCLLTRRT